jgi:hypothetical protein
MRPPAALWLSGDYEYSNVSETGNGSRRNAADSPTVTKEGAGEALVDLDPHTSKRTNATVTRTPTNVPHSSEPAVFTSPRVRPPIQPLPASTAPGPVHHWPPKWPGRLYLSHAVGLSALISLRLALSPNVQPHVLYYHNDGNINHKHLYYWAACSRR